MSASGLGNNNPSTFIKLKEVNKRGYVVITILATSEDLYTELIDASQYINRFIDRNGVPKIEICFGFIEGYLRKIEARDDPKYGKSWNITLTTDSGQSFTWSTGYDSLLVQNFVNCVASIDEPIGSIKLTPYTSEYQGSTRVWVSTSHNGIKLVKKYANADLPPMPAIKDEDGNDMTDASGNVLYNKKKRIAWLVGEIDQIVSKLNANNASARHALSEEVEVEELDAQPY